MSFARNNSKMEKVPLNDPLLPTVDGPFNWLSREAPPPTNESSLLLRKSSSTVGLRRKDTCSALLSGRVVISAEEDLTHGWTLLRFEGGGCVALSLVDPDVRVTRLPLQPPPLGGLVGQRIARVSFGRNELPVVLAEPRHLLLFTFAAKVGRLLGVSGDKTATRQVGEWVPHQLSQVVAPVFDRTEPYTLAVVVVDALPGTPVCPAGQGIMRDARRTNWSTPSVLRLPPPVAVAPWEVRAVKADRQCVLQ
eukprot:Hpha_TRINITY_DN9965_c0_g1::TRINITY_DN9965_c0_g1_i1::g.140554::m.140554